MASELTSRKISNKDKQDMMDTTEKVRMSLWIAVSYGLLNMDTPVLADQQNLTIICKNGDW